MASANVTSGVLPHDLGEEPEREDGREGRRRDPEILQLERIARMLDELDEAARRRVIVYLTDRYASATCSPL